MRVDAKRTEKNKERYLKNLEKCGGHLSQAAKMTGVTYRATLNWRKDDPEFDEAVEDIHQSTLDDIQASLYQKAIGKKTITDDGEVKYEGGDTIAAIFVMKTQGAKRGFVEKKQLEVSSGGRPVIFLPAQMDAIEEAQIVETKELSQPSDE